MIEIGSGLAAVLGTLAGGLATFAATWLSSFYERRDSGDEREHSRAQALQEAQVRANAEAVAAGRTLLSIGRRWEEHQDRRGDDGLPPEDIVRDFEVTYSRLADAVGQVAIVGPGTGCAFKVLDAADNLPAGLRFSDSAPPDRLTVAIRELAEAAKRRDE